MSSSASGEEPSSSPSQNGRPQNGRPRSDAAPGSSSPAAADQDAAASASAPLARLRRLLRRFLAPALLLPDLAVLYVAFIGALKARYGSWTLPGDVGLTGPLLVTLVAYPALLAAVGLYRTRPRDMHLTPFLRTGGACLGAWAVSVTLMYLIDRKNIPSRSVMALHCLLTMVGLLGLRAVLRQGLEWNASSPSFGADDGAAASAHRSDGALQIDDLLTRPGAPVEIDDAALRDHLAGRTVLVTGAGGSIGSELSEQLLQLNPFRLVLVDVSEYNLFQLEHALRPRSFDGELEFCIADVRERSIMEGLFADFQPDVILHTAAYKHVPLMERHPAEAFRNNTLTTVTLMELSREYDAEQFVFVSTDKAVEPQSVLGATKRLAEWHVRSREGRSSGPKCKIVRFGNVFGSQGSVVPLFEKQLRSGGSARVTHPDMERYFMSTHEACSLTLQTLLLESAPVYMFDMGEPVSIQWLAEEMVRHLRPGSAPADHIVHTGIRPGEKLREKLRTPAEESRPTGHDRVRGLCAPAPHPREPLDAYFRTLKTLCANRRNAVLRRALFAEDLAETMETLGNRLEDDAREESPFEVAASPGS